MHLASLTNKAFIVVAVIYCLIIHCHGFANFRSIQYKRYQPMKAVPEWLATEIPQEGDIPNITVRFINTVEGDDVVTHVPIGSNLLAIGDAAGVKLPRACRTGLCGSCTCDVQDPNAIATPTNPRDGFATIRACSAKCFVPEGMTEMVIDVHRMRKTANAAARRRAGAKVAVEDYMDPMARFSGDWEKEFRPQWELGVTKEKGVGQVGAASDPKSRLNVCQKCAGSSRVSCYNCSGTGRLDGRQCVICVGMMTVGCGYCRGTGMRNK